MLDKCETLIERILAKGMFILIDNYDSFSYNLVHYLIQLGAEVEVHLNDAISAAEIAAKKPEGIIISPGPKTPDEAGICLEIVDKFSGKLPILGVCLGHQVIAQSFGGTVVQAPKLMHGKVSDIHHHGEGVFVALPSPFSATRYHSLTVDPKSFPKNLKITAKTDNGVIMGLQHKTLPLYGVQFHPESILSEHGHALLQNFLNLSH